MLKELKDLTHKILRKSEKYTKTDMVYLTEGGFWLTNSKVVTAVGALITSVVFANLIPEANYGVFRYVISFMGVLSIFTLTGIDTALVKEIGKGNSGNFIAGLKAKIKWGIIGSIISIGISFYYFLNQNIDLSIAFLITAIFIPFMDSFYIYMSYLNGIKQYYLYTKYHTIIKSTVVITLVSTVLLTKNILVIIFAYFAIHTILRLIFLLITIKKNNVQKEKENKEITSFGKHLTLMQGLGTISLSIDKILLFHYVGAVSLAGYFLALVPFKQMQGAFGSLNILALPKFSNNPDPKILKSTLPGKIIKFYIIIIPTILLYFIFADLAFKLIYPKYVEFVYISKIFMTLLVFFPTTILQTALTATNKTRELYLISIISTMTRIVLLSILIPIFGLMGAVVSIFISKTINTVVLLYHFFKNTD